MKRAAFLLVVSALFAACNGGTVDRHALKKDSDAIDSLACEGALLAKDVSRGASTGYFVRVHAGELAQRASNFADALSERPTVDSIEAKVRAESRKAGKIADLLAELHAHPEERQVAQRLREQLQKQGGCA